MILEEELAEMLQLTEGFSSLLLNADDADLVLNTERCVSSVNRAHVNIAYIYRLSIANRIENLLLRASQHNLNQISKHVFGISSIMEKIKKKFRMFRDISVLEFFFY